MAAAETFSFSRVTTFEQCPRRYRYRYLDGVREAFQSIEAFMGQRVHEAIEWLFREKGDGRLRAADEAVREYTAAFDREFAAARGSLKVIRQGTAVEEYRRSGAAMLADFHKDRFRSDSLETVGIEKHFVLEIEPGTRFQGYIDRLARDARGTTHIIDYKTGGRPPSSFTGKDADQLEAYAIAMFEQTTADELVLTLEYLRNGSTQSRRIRREDTAETRRRLVARIRMAGEASVFPTSPGALCDWCGYNDLCESYRPRVR
ncbi:MAG TPA: PD-(D/E)XK nuclease family protein [Candidatus Binatia bacterium]|jgi:putative RecB family exonuclease